MLVSRFKLGKMAVEMSMKDSLLCPKCKKPMHISNFGDNKKQLKISFLCDGCGNQEKYIFEDDTEVKRENDPTKHPDEWELLGKLFRLLLYSED